MSNYQANIITKNPATPTGPVQTGSAPGMWRMDEVSYWLKQGVWPTQGVTGADPYFPYVTLLLSTTSLGNASNNLFVDSSGAFNPIARSGNTTQGSATPYSANWSNYFDGSGDYLTLPYASALQFPGDFTVEAWVFPIARLQPYPCIVSNYSTYGANGGFSIFAGHNSANTAKYQVAFNGSFPFIQSTSDIIYNSWSHIALIRSGSTITLYVNGVANGTATSSATVTGTANSWWVGTSGDVVSSGEFNGYISNLRAVKGTAVYTANFTVPTAPLTAISGTSLLTCQSNRFRDASSNNFTITRNGDTRVTDFSPFSPSAAITYNQSDITNWSNYFDGNGDYLTVPSSSAFNYGTGDFTIECWGYRGSSSNFWCGYSASGVSFTLFSYSGASSTIQVYSSGFYDSGINPGYNTWFHVAVTRSSGTLRIFINGVQGFSGSYTTDISSHAVRIGSSTANEWGLGNVSNLRVVKGTALYTSNFTPPTTNLTAVSGTSLLTCQSAAFTDNSTNNFVITPTGEVTVTGNSPFNTVGYWSNYFDGSGDYLQMPSNAAFAFGTGDYTIEGWIYVTVGGLDQRVTWFSDDRHNIDINTSNQIFLYDGAIRTFGTVTVGTWNHFAVSRTSGTVSCYLNGVRGYNASETTNSSTRSMNIAANNAGNGYFNGYISNIRVVKGTGVYSGATITVPTTPLTAITNTSLLTCQNGRFIDNSTNAFTITANGNTSIQSFDPFYTSTIASNGGSMYFDGSGDYLAVPNSPTFNLSNNNFTLECWVYNNSISGDTGYMGIWDTGYILYRESSTYKFYYYGPGFTGLVATTPAITGAWTHLAVVRNGGTITFYINGTSAGTASIGTTAIGFPAAPFILGANWNNGSPASFLNGYMSNARLVNGTAVYTANFTPPTAPTAPTASTNLLVNGMNAGIYDAAAINDMETVGNAQVTTAVSKFGGSSVYFDGSGDYLSTRATADLMFGTGDVTLECWLYLNSTAGTQTIAARWATPRAWLWQFTSSTMTVYFGTTGTSFSWSPATGTWYHLAITRSSGNTRFFVNGVQTGSTQTNNGDATNNGTATIGINDDGIQQPLNGYIDDFRITKGIARYTSNFTPPTQAFPTF